MVNNLWSHQPAMVWPCVTRQDVSVDTGLSDALRGVHGGSSTGAPATSIHTQPTRGSPREIHSGASTDTASTDSASTVLPIPFSVPSVPTSTSKWSLNCHIDGSRDQLSSTRSSTL